MNKRSFLQSLCTLIAAPFAIKAVGAATQSGIDVYPLVPIVKNHLDPYPPRLKGVVNSLATRNKSEYRLYFADGYIVTSTKNPGVGQFVYTGYGRA